MGAFTFSGVDMARYAVFVDAGYLYAAGSALLNGGTAKKRHELCLDCQRCVEDLEARCDIITGLDNLLRVYWYDSTFSASLSTDQLGLGHTDDVKLRLGTLNGQGQQKGVDSRIVMDLVELARKRAITDAVLVSGDEDLRIGVEIAQEYGVRVHLLLVEGSMVSHLLRREADTVRTLDVGEVGAFLGMVPPYASPAPTPLGPAPATFGPVVSRFTGSLAPAVLAALTYAASRSRTVPEEHDGRLLAQAKAALGRDLMSQERVALRRELRSQLGV